MKGILRLSFLSLALALDFQWSYSGQAYYAVEVDRITTCSDTLNLLSRIGSDGLGYFSVGDVNWPQFGFKWPQFSSSIRSSAMEPGAYIVANLSDHLVIAKAYQLMEDPQQAFMTGVIPAGSDDSYRPIFGIPVSAPSKGEGILAGLNFAVKDLFHVKGVKTAAGSRAYYASYPAQNHTSGIILKTLRAGASLVGKTKTTAFALTTIHNGWEVDYHDPFNSRGDGYLSTAGSSSGSGAAVTAYDWLDFAIGSDTGGSVRLPSTNGGLFGYRPSQGIYDLEGVVPCVLSMDTPGFMTRSPALFSKLFAAWSEGTELAIDTKSISIPTKLKIRADLTSFVQTEAQSQLSGFFDKVASSFNMTLSTIDINELWMENIVNETIHDYFETVYLDLNSLESWDLIGEPLTSSYSTLTSGAKPPVDPSVNLTWTNGQNLTIRSRYDEAVSRGKQFREFYSKYVLPRTPESCSESLIAFTYYAEPPDNKVDLIPFDYTGGAVTGGFFSTLPASYGGAPEIVVPFGQVPYFSNFTRRIEYRPITATFQAARGCDAVLFKLVDEMAEMGLVSEVQTGKLAFAL
ncbi:hypothetical protein HYFRA_00013242 [Hymenoscyphus fraxineus]|uniref:Amidase domain-containing protein n=1 Tax=Hymenoscyphus fraxineus TaxID=746836 RepID=A0A9N9L6K4_9HELO|nr:hypothetical protein HYFRA_00013242 [Hymenoscyphus fraxineus]